MPTLLSKVDFQGKVLQEEKVIPRQSYEKIILETIKTISNIMNAVCHDNQWHFACLSEPLLFYFKIHPATEDFFFIKIIYVITNRMFNKTYFNRSEFA